MAGFYFATNVPEALELTGGAARGLYVASSEHSAAALEPTPAAQRFLDDFGAPGDGFALEAAQAAELVMDAIARSDGTRASVLEELRASRVRNGLLGSFRFDANGDRTPASVPIIRITGRPRRTAGLPAEMQGAVVDRIVAIPPRLLR